MDGNEMKSVSTTLTSTAMMLSPVFLWRFKVDVQRLLFFIWGFSCCKIGWDSVMRMRHFCIIILFFLRCSQIWNGQYVEWFINRDDIWCRDCSLASTFPRLVRIASNRHALVDDCYHLDSGRMVWDVRFLRPFKDLEMEDAIDFFGFVILTGDSGGDSDLCIWIPSSHGRFDVPSFCRCLWMLLHCHFHGGPFGEQSACQSSFFCMDIRFGKELDPGQPLEKKTLW